MRVRSSSSVRRARSASLMVSCSINFRWASPRSRSVAPIISTTPVRTNSSTQVPLLRSGALGSKRMPATPVVSQTAIRVRLRSRSDSATISAR